jgi:O-antigen ligase
VTSRADLPALAALSGAAAAALHFAGALKSAPLLAGLPLDLTLLAAAALAALLPLLVVTRHWRLDAGLGAPLAAAGALWLWMLLAGLWSPSAAVLAEKLPPLVLVAPVMLAAGLLVGADDAARAAFAGATLAAGLLVGASVSLGIAGGEVVLGGLPGLRPDLVRVQYQLVGLALACAAGLAALRALEARGLGRLAWLAALAALTLAALLPGGRTGLLALGAAVAAAPAAALLAAGRGRAAAGLLAAGTLLAAGGLAFLAARPDLAEGLRTVERLFEGPVEASARPALWAAALDWAGEAAPLGLGTGAFTIAAGFGERRGMYPHNHALEALAEGGLPGLALWLAAFGGAALLLIARLRRLDPGRAGRIVALTVPVAITAMVSTDLGNRMVWLALGLALSVAVAAEPRFSERTAEPRFSVGTAEPRLSEGTAQPRFSEGAAEPRFSEGAAQPRVSQRAAQPRRETAVQRDA